MDKAEEPNAKKPVLLGCVEIDGKPVWCGVRVLTEKEAAENDGSPFSSEELLGFPEIEKNSEEARKRNLNNLSNIKILARNLLEIQQQESFKEIYHQMNTTSYQAEQLERKEDKQDADPAIQYPATEFHCGDIIAYTLKLTQENPNVRIAILNPANSTHLGGGAFLGANALEEIFFRCSNLAFAYIKHGWEKGIIYKKYGDTARPDYQTPLRLGEAWFTPNITFTQCPADKAGEYQSCEHFSVGVICSAAPIYSSIKEARADQNNEKIIKAEIRAQLTAARENHVQIPVLTAFGCGAFANDPVLVGRYYAEILYEERYIEFFKEVHFAIWKDPDPSMPDNERPFREAFQMAQTHIEASRKLLNLLEKLQENDPIRKAGEEVLAAYHLLHLTLLEEQDKKDLLESLKLATAVVQDPKNQEAIKALKTHALEVANGKPDQWNQLGCALMMLAGIAIVALSVAGIPFSGGTSLAGMYIASTLIAAGGAYGFFRNSQPQGLSKKLFDLASNAKSAKAASFLNDILSL
jgi:uncharacterized protein (TIGR02452 family)